MIRGSRLRCHRILLTVPAVAVCGVAPCAATAQTRINFASSLTSESMRAVWVARERGLFKKHVLDMQYLVMQRATLALVALMAGEIDAAIVGSRHLISAGAGGADLVGVANFFQKLDYRLNVRPDIGGRKICVARKSR